MKMEKTKPSAEQIEKKVLFWLQEVGGKATGTPITSDTELLENGILDSVGILNLVSYLEEEFGFVVPFEEFVPENFKTPAAIVAMIVRLG
jgi:acyl carrier protein